MKFAIIVSTKDPAGMNIKECLLEGYGFKEEGSFQNHPVFAFENAKLYTTDKASIECDDIEVEEEMIIFATKHQSAKGVNSLSVHCVGNWGEAGMGGKDKELVRCPARYLKHGLLKLIELNKREDLQFDVIQEVTHHGPYTEKPTMFIEIGSELSAWQRKDAGKAIAEAIIFLIRNEPPSYEIAFGIGGLHHSPKFTRYMLERNICFGHICPKYRLEDLDGGMIKQAIDKSGATLVFLEWKALAKEKQRITSMLDELKIKYERI